MEGEMLERIILRVTENHWRQKEKNKNGSERYRFIGFNAGLLKKEYPKRRSEWTDYINACPIGNATLEEITLGVLSYDEYRSMNHPSIEILPWEGKNPESDVPGPPLLTKIPNIRDIDKLEGLLIRFYALKELISQKRYDELFNTEKKDDIFYEALKYFPEEDKIKYYCELREKDKRKAAAWQKKYFPLFQFSELEMHYLHHLEELLGCRVPSSK